MPGLSLSINWIQKHVKEPHEMIASHTEAIARIAHNTLYQFDTLIDKPGVFLGMNGYAAYPFQQFEYQDYIFYLEGRIYQSISIIHQTLEIIAACLCDAQKPQLEKLSSVLQTCDGEFLLIIFHKRQNTLFILNDILGRLPVYYYQDKQGFVLSREIAFLHSLRPRQQPDRLALAQTLLLNYAVGNRTLFKDFCRLSAATLMTINLKNEAIQKSVIYTFNYDDKPNQGKPRQQHIVPLYDRFIQATVARSINPGGDKVSNLVSLSGGLDSRAVAAALSSLNQSYQAVTFLDAEHQAKKDVDVAKQLANVLAVKWQLFSLSHPDEYTLTTLLNLKQGLNFLGMSFIIPFLQQLQDDWGSEAIYWTGDGGDKTLVDLSPKARITNEYQLMTYLLRKNGVCSLTQAAGIAGISEQDLIGSLYERLQDYPERSRENRYTHFLMFERAFKWLFEGEDRNRNWFWSNAPFYGLDFFKYAMSCQDSDKFFLYKGLLQKLSPAIANVNNANWNTPITSSKARLRFFMKLLFAKLSPKQQIWLQNTLKPQKVMQSMPNLTLLKTQQQNCPALKSYVNIDDPALVQGLDKDNVWSLLTLNRVLMMHLE